MTTDLGSLRLSVVGPSALGASEEPSLPDRRERTRIARRQQFLQAALDIVANEGIGPLTMQRVSDATDTSTGAVYRYFPTKNSLFAAMQAESIERLIASYSESLARLDSTIEAADIDDRTRALTRVAFSPLWFISCSTTLPQEFRLLQMLMFDMREYVGIEEGLRVLPIGLVLLEAIGTALDEAADLGALDQAQTSLERVICWGVALAALVEASRLSPYDAELLGAGAAGGDVFTGDHLTRSLSMSLLLGWGADRDELARATAIIDELAATGPLALVAHGRTDEAAVLGDRAGR